MREEPYFMTNKEWWYYDLEEGIVKLTDKAPQKAKDSYAEFYRPNADDGLVTDA